jgi:hypothetical protein
MLVRLWELTEPLAVLEPLLDSGLVGGSSCKGWLSYINAAALKVDVASCITITRTSRRSRSISGLTSKVLPAEVGSGTVDDVIGNT